MCAEMLRFALPLERSRAKPHPDTHVFTATINTYPDKEQLPAIHHTICQQHNDIYS